MNKFEYVNNIIKDKNCTIANHTATAFAASNIALSKYWGKRDTELNLPLTDSLSISLGELGTKTTVSVAPDADEIVLNDEVLSSNDSFVVRLKSFLDLFRPTEDFYFHIDTHVNFPVAAGFASSASGFAAVTMALDKLFGWKLDTKELSQIARIGSGSASRSVTNGFVYWHKGKSALGQDCFAEEVNTPYKDLRLGLVTITSYSKKVGSTKAMNITKDTSPLFSSWPNACDTSLKEILAGIKTSDFERIGKFAEQNAIAMHATMLSSIPSINYFLPATIECINQVQQLRSEGQAIYFTQDAGSNIKVLFESGDEELVKSQFNNIKIINPFSHVE